MGSRRSDNMLDDHYNLLKVLKQTAEWLLCCNASNVWNTYGGLSRFSTILDEILSHGLRYKENEKYWPVIRDLYRDDAFVIGLEADANSKEPSKTDRSLHRTWLEKSLLEHNLSQKLQKLIQDIHHVYLHYEETAFLRNQTCTAALLICVRAVEQNQLMMMMDLDPSLVPIPLDLQKTHVQKRVSARKEIHKLASTSSKSFQPVISSQTHSSKNQSRRFPDFLSQHNKAVADRSDSENSSIFSNILYKSPSSLRRTRRHRVVSKCSSSSEEHKRSMSHSVQNKVFHLKSNGEGDNEQCERGSRCPANHGLNKPDTLSINEFNLNRALVSLKRSSSCPDIHNAKSSASGIQNVLAIDDLKKLRIEPCSMLSNLIKTETHSSPGYVKGCDSACDSMYGSFSNVDDSLSHAKTDGNSSVTSLSSVTLAGDCEVAAGKVPHSRSESDSIGIIANRTSDTCDGSSQDPFLCTSLPNVLDEPGQQKTRSIFEVGGAITVPTECFFPRPEPGQTLTSFLSTDMNIRAELDRENAHFCISEALISAIEQIKCSRTLKYVEEEIESDEEIKKLTQRIRIRRREKLQERASKTTNLLSDGRTDTTTSHSASPLSTSHSSEFGTAESIGSDEENVEDLELSESTKSNLSSVKESGLSLSMASMYSDADLIKANVNVQAVNVSEEKRMDFDLNSVHLSAEAVALSLIKRFSEKQLPKASDLEWLVSEQDAPQRLLPLPDSWPVSPEDDDDYDLKKTRLRGNLEWAPPRRQIISIIHPKPRRKDAIVKQNYRCAGCGMKITQNYAKKFRYCEYLGKYFCQCCHANDLSHIPGRILWKWDFSKYHVSKFAFNLLDQMHFDPLFNVDAINSNLYRKSKQLDQCREYRQQMFYLRCFLRTCRNTEQIKRELESLPEHISTEPHMYSMNDLHQVRYGEFTKSMSNLVNRCIGHVMKCILCQGKGFICEMCDNEKDIIFPFQLTKVSHCKVCGSCFHKKCFKMEHCPKCVRIQERKKIQKQEIHYSDEEL